VNPGSAGPIPYLVSAVVFLAILLVYIWYYRRSLSKNKEREVIEKQAEAIGLSIPEGDE
jgi:cell division protein FtsL